ncbi:MAG: hypothetical protein V3W37_08100 [Candidatus Binatia bacterium]
MSESKAIEYREKVGETTIVTYSGSEFRVRVIDFMDYMGIVRGLRKKFPDDVTDETMFAIASDTSRPKVLYSYAEEALPLTLVDPKIVKRNLDADKAVKDLSVIGVDELSPMDLLKLCMATVMGATDVRLLMESFPGQ